MSYYQSKSGQTHCTPCYSKYTTSHRGSPSSAQCIGKVAALQYVTKTLSYACVFSPVLIEPFVKINIEIIQEKLLFISFVVLSFFLIPITIHPFSPYMHKCLLFSAMCIEGYVSRTGAVPCVPCPSYSYQPEIGKTYCLPCPTGSSADESGAKDINECRSQGMIQTADL